MMMSTSWRVQATFQCDDDDVHFVLDQHAYLFGIL
jgi:hypothetical protein